MAKAKVMEYNQNIKNKKANKNKLGLKRRVSKKQNKFQRKCFNYDKMVHKASECRMLKKKGNREANDVENISKDMSDINLSAVVS